MAKVGEGDPRWLVQDRQDGTNVNNWHWTEKDCTPWAKSRLNQLLENQVIVDNSEERVETKTFEDLNCEVSINTRKGKIFYFFEIDFKLKWEGKKNDAKPLVKKDDEKSDKQRTYKGTINLPGLSEETEDEMEITVSREGGSNEAEYFRRRIEQTFVPRVRENLRLILKELREEQTPKLKATSSTSLNQSLNSSQTSVAVTNGPQKPQPVSTVTLQTEFNAPPQVIFENLLDQNCVSAFTQSSCQIEKRPGSKFTLLNGTITGEILELQAGQLIKQKWRFADWDSGVFSTVTMDLKTAGTGGCILHLNQTGVPTNDKTRVHDGWESVFFNRLRVMMGYGGDLL